jgi:hypothetical protein
VASPLTKSVDVGWTADRIEMLNGGDAMLSGHVAIHYPSADGEASISAERVTRESNDGPSALG